VQSTACSSAPCRNMEFNTDMNTVQAASSSFQMCSFADLIPCPKRAALSSTRKRKVAHAEVVTGSPYKTSLLEAKSAKSAGSGKGNAVNKKKSGKKATKIMMPRKREHTNRNRPTAVTRPGDKVYDSDDERLSSVCGKRLSNAPNSTAGLGKYCSVRYGDDSDLKAADNWIQCCGCSALPA
jgi:hypothetical protein